MFLSFILSRYACQLGERGIKPEELPPADDIKKLERRVAREEKALGQDAQKLPQAQAVGTEKE